ncbi:transcription initiation factor TFIID subunit 6 [Thraustotheca clavata]|uniref:Transcription initiation factor TFIID subunit 6 n=1 Tax=Thraustotheca clavata TaxID=74557 RepID=A0A1W0A4W6_9STRA|nr:transcription initiation factor TFIID subunit 6 [Thraustotheca clavata]
MSVLREESIAVIGQSIGLEKLKKGCASELAPEVEFRLREIIQDAIKFQTHARRETLTTRDINHALSTRNMEVLYGYGGGDGTSYRKIAPGLFIPEDSEIRVFDILNAPLPLCPLVPNINMHWLAVEGVQPQIPENDVTDTNWTSRSTTSISDPAFVGNVTRKPLVKHVLTDEMQLYYTKVTDAVKSDDFVRQQAAYNSLSNDPGLHQVMPYFSRFIYEEVKHSNHDLPLISSVLRMARALLHNVGLRIELYLHQMIPAILTCILNKDLCANPTEDHWAVRNYGARLIAEICSRFGDTYDNLQPRVSKTYHAALLDPTKPFTTHYGAILGLMYLGPLVMERLLFPHLTKYLEALLPCFAPSNSNQVLRLEAQNCFGVLVHAAGRYLTLQTTTAMSKDFESTFEKLQETFGEALVPYMQTTHSYSDMLSL